MAANTFKKKAIGIIGENWCNHSMIWNQCSPILKPSVTSQPVPESTCLEHLLDGSGLESIPKMVACKSSAKWFKLCYVPSEWLLNWMENETRCIILKDNIGWHWKTARKLSPPAQAKLAVPVQVVNHIHVIGNAKATKKTRAMGDVSHCTLFSLASGWIHSRPTKCMFVHFVFDLGIILFIQAKTLPISPQCYRSSCLQYSWIPWRWLPSVPSQVT
jgi:hypothetical protein